MEIMIGTAIATVIVQFGLLWYRVGRLEQKVTDLCREVHESNNKRKEEG